MEYRMSSTIELKKSLKKYISRCLLILRNLKYKYIDIA
jgi:hypothetical protein